MQWILAHQGADGPPVDVTVEAETSQKAIAKVKATLPESRKIGSIRRSNYPGLPDETDERTDL